MGLLDIIKNGVTFEPRPIVNSNNTLPQNEVTEAEAPTQAETEEFPPEPVEEAESIHDRQEIATAILYQTPAPVYNNTVGQNNFQNNYQTAFMGQTLSNQNILVTSLKSQDEIRPILDNLTSGNPCVVSLDDSDTPQRHLDFLSGFVTAINGTIKQIDPTKLNYILTPKGVGVK
jgi:FtsZ-interacting cell division protein YlmF